jgi:predicted Zn finger-like uncharacterized protein
MYITCPECYTRFAVTADEIGKNGRKVKCSKCFNIWHQKPFRQVRIEPKVESLYTKTPPLGNGINLPVLLPIKVPAANVFCAGLTVNPIPTALVVNANPEPLDALVNVK